MDLEFRQADTMGLGWEQQVVKSGLVVGRIRKNAIGVYGFVPGRGGTGAALVEEPVLTHEDLDRLKDAIRQHLA